MRVQREINEALDILDLRTDRISLIQRSILTDKRTEAWVFEHYVKDVSEADKDEEAFYAARDAARFLSGSLTLEELIPDIPESEPSMPDERNEPEADDSLIAQLVRRIERLEKQMKIMRSERKTTPCKHVADYTKDDFMTQTEAYHYIGCSQASLIRWTNNGIVAGYRKGSHVYYSKSALDENPMIRNFMNINKSK